METQRKPSFEVQRAITLVKIDGKVYNATPIGPKNWHNLRNAEYGQGFRQGSFGENVGLVHAAYMNQDSQEAQAIVCASRKSFITGNTAILYTPQTIFVQDSPQVTNRQIVMDAQTLESKIGKKTIQGVTFSDDGSVRAIPYDFAKEWQTSEQMRKNPFAIALTGDENAPEKIAEMQDVTQKKGYVWALGKGTQNEIRVPGVDGFDYRVFLGGDRWYEFLGDGYSFGVQQ